MNRRDFLATTATFGATAALSCNASTGASPGPDQTALGRLGLGPGSIAPGDPRFEDLVLRPNNRRFAPRPASFQIVGSTDQVIEAVGDAVRAGQRITVRSGAHCYENFVGDPAPQTIIDMLQMNAVYFDHDRGAFAVEPGALLSEVFQTLYYGWGVTIPGGTCGTVAAGGHIQGGAYGPLSRRLGSVVDYLDAVEVVVVGRDGRARAIVATREPDDPDRDLWWAHTGGGGGNFGVVTRYWLRSPGAAGNDPTSLLPRPPTSVLSGVAFWSWKDLTRDSFRRLMQNHGQWHERNSAPDTHYDRLFTSLFISNQAISGIPGEVLLTAQVDGSLPDARSQMTDYFAAVGAGVPGGTSIVDPAPTPWLSTVKGAVATFAETSRQKNKAAYLRRRYGDAQIDMAYARLSRPDPSVGVMMLWLVSYGGKVNAVDPAATALPQRDSIFKVIYVAAWQSDAADPEVDDRNMDWVRQFYRAMYADTGGVPVPNETNDGAYINDPDIDLADPAWNTSGVPWYTLYYKANYRQPQRTKARYDPRDVFNHKLSIRPT